MFCEIRKDLCLADECVCQNACTELSQERWMEFKRGIGFASYVIERVNNSHGFTRHPPAGWEIDYKATKIALMHSELSEALEALRKPHKDEHCPEFDNEVIELADCVIRILHYCAQHKLPLAEAIHAKVVFNTTRPYMHNKIA